MTEPLKPENPKQVLEAVQWAVANKICLDVQGRGTKKGLGRSVEADQVLDMSGLSGIIDYQPSELYVTAHAGTPISEIQAALDQQNQQLMFEPPDYGPLLGGAAGQGTLGGVVACNLSGPRRVKAGAARDNFIGFQAVSGRGEDFKSGGKVVKNVTGFDLSKLITGSYGTLAVITEATFKVLPSPEKIRTVLVLWPQNEINDHGGIQAMTEALQSTNEVSGAAHLPAAVAQHSSVAYVSGSGRAVTAVRVEGPSPSVDYRCAALIDILSRFGDIEELHSHNSQKLWQEISDVSYFADDQERILWRLSVPPSQGADVAQRILKRHPGEIFYDWSGGLIWLCMDMNENGAEGRIRRCVRDVAGHATLMRGDEVLRLKVPVFQPLSSAMHEISKRIKEGFDPEGILNPSRMYEGI